MLAFLIIAVVCGVVFIPLFHFLNKGSKALYRKYGNEHLKNYLNSEKVKAEDEKEEQDFKTNMKGYLVALIAIVVLVVFAIIFN